MNDKVQYISNESLEKLKKEIENIKDQKIPEIAKKIDEAKQLGDLSENAEYHQAKDDMAWAQGRLIEIENIIAERVNMCPARILIFLSIFNPRTHFQLNPILFLIY